VQRNLSRRGFLAASAAAGIGLMAKAHGAGPAFKTVLHKAVIRGNPTEELLKGLKDVGFEGVEASPTSVEQAARAREAAEKLGMRIHSVLRGWVNFNGKDPAGDIRSVESALRAAQAYGADAILLVPCRTGAAPMPQPWEFDIQFDEKTGHITRLTAGGDEKFKAYIEAHDHATDTSIAALKQLIPVAEQTKVAIALENVWNNLWVRPDIFKWLVASFQSPWIKAYFDIGNHVRYAGILREGQVRPEFMPEAWIRTLGSLLAKLHAKDYKLNPDCRNGNWAAIGAGSVNWPTVRKALDEVGYNGWLTDETGLGLPELSRRFDRIIAGQDPVARDK